MGDKIGLTYDKKKQFSHRIPDIFCLLETLALFFTSLSLTMDQIFSKGQMPAPHVGSLRQKPRKHSKQPVWGMVDSLSCRPLPIELGDSRDILCRVGSCFHYRARSYFKINILLGIALFLTTVYQMRCAKKSKNIFDQFSRHFRQC